MTRRVEGIPMEKDKEINRLRDIFKRNRNKTFIVDALNGKEYTYADIERLSLNYAAYLEEVHGVKKGDKIAISLPNCIEFTLLYFACMQAGAITVPINPKLHEQEIKYILENSEAKVAYTTKTIEKALKEAPSLADDIRITSFTPLHERRGSEKDEFDLLKEANRKRDTAKRPFDKVEDEDTIVIIYTSGTTKRPKGVMIEYKNLIGNGLLFSKTIGAGPHSRFYNILPLAYLGGFYNLTMIPFLSEGSSVLEETFCPKVALGFWERAKRFRVNTLWLVPTIISILLSIDRSNADDKLGNDIKLALVGTAPLPAALKKRFEERYGLILYENYALSETFFISTNSPSMQENKGVGKIMPMCTVTITDESGKALKAGETGEIIVKTPYVMKGYYKNEEETKATIREGRLYTGDVGHIDRDRYLFITDRKKDIIIRGGINISPKEIEDVICTNPLVNEVAVIGIPNENSGEEIIAVVKANLELKPKDIRSICLANLAAFKVPERVILTGDFPRSVTGKIQKNKLREMIIQGKLK